ncbi:MAG: dihydrolipoyllysine-residue acetyltransferase component of pyruvatedehydrogenase complex [Neobacillus sp.]|nr:dihydrolipoyllysine-residue acetyltransferase component of pyruvatedehydrogenase complex [Neobacillus sp.]
MLPDGRMITPVILNASSMTLQELSDAVCELREKINNTNIDKLLYQAIKTDTLIELRKLNLGILRRILAAKFSFHPIRGLKGKEKAKYYSTSMQHRLTDHNLTSGTVTVSNIGSLYREQRGHFGILEIVPPQILAVGLGAIQEKPGIYVDDDGQKKIGIRKVLPMCIAFDHRAIDFNTLVPFLKRLDEVFAQPCEIQNW